VAGKTGTLVLAEYSLDRLGPKPVLRLPTAKRGSADHLANSNVPSDLQEKVASLLASESSRKVRPGAQATLPEACMQCRNQTPQHSTAQRTTESLA
jgi:hypothetical protein